MKIQLVHYKDDTLGAEWRKRFDSHDDVAIVEGNICQMEVDAVVSPANSFGFIDGGLDLYLSERFGWDVQDRLQKLIKARPMRELLVGEAMVIPTEDAKVPWIISAPTMRVPMRLRQSINAYLAMKAILSVALSHTGKPGIETVAIPGLGTGCGKLPPEVAAIQMHEAYSEIICGEDKFPDSFGKAQRAHINLNLPEINLWDP